MTKYLVDEIGRLNEFKNKTTDDLSKNYIAMIEAATGIFGWFNLPTQKVNPILFSYHIFLMFNTTFFG